MRHCLRSNFLGGGGAEKVTRRLVAGWRKESSTACRRSRPTGVSTVPDFSPGEPCTTAR